MGISRGFVRNALVSNSVKRAFHLFLDTWDAMVGNVTAGTVSASATIVAGASKDIDTLNITGKLFENQGAPETATDTATMTDAQMLSGILVATPTVAAAYTLRTGAQLEAALVAAGYAVRTGMTFDWTIINKGGAGDDITVTAPASGITLEGNAVVTVAVPSQGTFRFRRTAADTFVAYRVA